jgi:alanyl-tRNA synthetase
MNQCITAYYEDTYQFTDDAVIGAVNQDDQGHFFILDKTIFYPQGGGQPSDEGTIKTENDEIPIFSVKSIGGQIRHYTNQPLNHLVGQKVMCRINPSKRMLHAKLHTAGHLISNIIEKIYPDYKAIKGHHFPGECYVEFLPKDKASEIDLIRLNQNITTIINENHFLEVMNISNAELSTICPSLPYAIPGEQPIRVVRIGEFPYQPCGGTHIKTTNELEGLSVTRSKIKGNRLKINYTI